MNMWSLTCDSNERDPMGGKLSAATIGTAAYHEISINSSDTGYASVEKKTTGSQATTSEKSLSAIKKPTIDHSSFDSFESCCFSSDLDRIKIENSSSSSSSSSGGGNSLSITFKRTSSSSSSSSSSTNQNEEEQPTAIDKRIDFYDDDHKNNNNNNNTTLSTSDEELSDLRATASSSIDDECIKLTG